MIQFLQSALNELKAIKAKVLPLFDDAEKVAIQAVQNLNISSALTAAAGKAVTDAEAAIIGAGTGSSKFSAAVAAVAKDFEGVAIGVLQTAVQNAWGALFGAAAAPAAPATPPPAASTPAS